MALIITSMTLKEFKPDGLANAGDHYFPEDSDEWNSMVWFRRTVTGPQGARYELFRETHQTDNDIKAAKEYLRKNFDVVSIRIIKETV